MTDGRVEVSLLVNGIIWGSFYKHSQCFCILPSDFSVRALQTGWPGIKKDGQFVWWSYWLPSLNFEKFQLSYWDELDMTVPRLGWEVEMSGPPISRPARLLMWKQWDFHCSSTAGARSKQPSKPVWLGSCEDTCLSNFEQFDLFIWEKG